MALSAIPPNVVEKKRKYRQDPLEFPHFVTNFLLPLPKCEFQRKKLLLGDRALEEALTKNRQNYGLSNFAQLNQNLHSSTILMPVVVLQCKRNERHATQQLSSSAPPEKVGPTTKDAAAADARQRHIVEGVQVGWYPPSIYPRGGSTDVR